MPVNIEFEGLISSSNEPDTAFSSIKKIFFDGRTNIIKGKLQEVQVLVHPKVNDILRILISHLTMKSP
jgi:hypothetical protein